MSNGIAMRQNEEGSIAMLAAQRQLYSEAKNMAVLDTVLSVWVPFTLAILLLIFPNSNIIQCASYMLAIVSMIFTFIIEQHIDNKKESAAYIQQKFDIHVYTMPWNEKLFGKDKDIYFEVAAYSKLILSKPEKKEKLYDWNITTADSKSLDEGILTCQRENFWWDVGLRKRFKFISVAFIVALVVFVFLLGVCKNETVGVLCCRVVFIAPMLKWLLLIVRRLDKDIKNLNKLDESINDSKKKTMEDLQYIQQMIFEHRKSCYAIPNWVYTLFKNNDEDNAKRAENIY